VKKNVQTKEREEGPQTMPAMNKQVAEAVSSRASELENELIGTEVDLHRQREGGKVSVDEGTPFQANALKSNRLFQIRQGKRRRHPNAVLNQFKAMSETTSDASEQWEKSLLWETERASLPKEFKPRKDVTGMSTQLGISAVAAKNYKNSKPKLDQMFLVGV
jgi:hypothetical protein